MRVGISTRTTTGVHKLNQHYRNYRDKKFQVAELGGQALAGGYDYHGAFGVRRNNIYRSSPVIWGGKAQKMMDISSAGYNCIHVVDTDGNMWGAGYNYYGQLGVSISASNYYSSPVQVPGTWTRNRGGGDTYKTTFWKDDQLYMAGIGGVGQLAQSDTVPRSSPTLVSGKWFARAECVWYDMHAFEHGGRVWVWGSNYYGVLGMNNITNYSSPIIQYGSHQWAVYRPMGSHVMAIDGGTGKLYGWGLNSSGQLGQGNVQPYSYPVQVPGDWSYMHTGDNTQAIFHIAIRDGQAMAWGYNSYGNLGNGVRNLTSSMIMLPGTWTKIMPFNYGTQFFNGRGELFVTGYVWQQGMAGYRSSPTKIPGNYRYDPTMPANTVNASYGGSLFLADDGKEYLLGSNYYNQMQFDPLKSANNYTSSPVLVRGDWAAHHRWQGGNTNTYWSTGIGATC